MKKLFCSILLLGILLAGCQDSAPDADRSTPLPTTEATTTPVTEPVYTTVEVMREGEVSTIAVRIVPGSIGGYTVAMDECYFVHKGEEGLDEFLYESWEGSQPVYYSIGIYVEGAPSFEEQMMENYADQFAEYSFSDTEIAGYPAKEAIFWQMEDDPSYCHHVFLLDTGDLRYEIHAQFTMEMYEGLYPIIRACLETFSLS